MHAIHLYQQPLDRCGDNTYYWRKSTMMTCIRFFTVFVVLLATMMFPLKPTLQPCTFKILLQSVVSEISWHWTSRTYTSWHLCRARNTVQTLYNIT
jgi:hypothetical protein